MSITTNAPSTKIRGKKLSANDFQFLLDQEAFNAKPKRVVKPQGFATRLLKDLAAKIEQHDSARYEGITIEPRELNATHISEGLAKRLCAVIVEHSKPRKATAINEIKMSSAVAQAKLCHYVPDISSVDFER